MHFAIALICRQLLNFIDLVLQCDGRKQKIKFSSRLVAMDLSTKFIISFIISSLKVSKFIILVQIL